jgi:peroxiredoxin Q/BCP
MGWFCARSFGTPWAMPMLNVGDAAPDFTLLAHDGQTVKLSELHGKNVVLWFYPKADTPG